MEVLAVLGNPRVAIMFDWYHVVAECGHVAAVMALDHHRANIGHVQAASFPDRNEPELAMVEQTGALGFKTIGLEYRPTTQEKVSLSRLRGVRGT